MSDLSFRANYGDIRSRLRNPPNAVPDTEIDLRRVKVIPISSNGIAPLEIETSTPADELRAVNEQVRTLESELGALYRRRQVLNGAVAVVSVEDIQKLVCARYNLDRNDIKSARRFNNVTLPRQVAMYLCRRLTPRSFPEIGRLFGGRDHTTVLHAVRKIEALCDENGDFRKQVDALIEELKGAA